MCKIDRSEMITNRLTREVSELKAHSMNYNLVFSFDRSTDSNKYQYQHLHWIIDAINFNITISFMVMLLACDTQL